MKQRGRRSAAAKAIVIRGGFARPPEPPPDLTERQRQIWIEVTETEARNFFSTGALRGLLADYCRRRATSEGISALINEFKIEWLKDGDSAARYRELLLMRDCEVRATVMLATKLRLTNQSRYIPEAAGAAARDAFKGPAPWELNPHLIGGHAGKPPAE